MTESYRPKSPVDKDYLIQQVYRNAPRDQHLDFMSHYMFQDLLPLWEQAKEAKPRKRKVILNRLVSGTTSWQQRVYHWEHIHKNQKAKSEGYETLTTNTRGFRSNQWFSETGLSFSTGIARPCAVAVVLHKDIGIAAAHRNPYTQKVIQRFMGEALELSADLSDDLLLRVLAPQITNLTFKEIGETFAQTTNEALSEFKKLLRQTGISHAPAKGVSILWCGMESSQIQPTALLPVYQPIISSHPVFHGARRGREMSVRADHDFFGQAGGFLYSGPDHPDSLQFTPASQSGSRS